MDLIYTNPDRVDIGVLHEYELDLAFGADENNFECTINAAAHCCEAGSYLYFDGTEYGGIIDGIQSNGNDKEVIYSGRTWHGILNSKVIEPDSGAAYLTVSGEANAVLGTLIDRMGLADLYEASSDNSGLTISNYKMHRYISGYDGITKMLDSVGARIRVVFTGGKVILSAVKKYDYSKDEEFDSDQVGFTIKKNYKAVNHLICLGSGELEKRLVVHLYVDKDGNISQTQTQFGLDEVSSIYEYSSVSTEEELIAAGTEQLAGLNESEEVSIDFDAESDVYDVGDVVGAYDNITGLYISTRIAKKIVTIKNGKITVSLTPDTAKTGSTMESSASASTGGNVEPCIHTNPNLLDNWYFANLVNQRGQTEYAGTGYTIDRWKSTNSRTTLTVGDGFCTLSAAKGGSGYVRQTCEIEFNGIYTISLLARGTGKGDAYFSTDGASSGIGYLHFENPGDNWVLFSQTFDCDSGKSTPNQISLGIYTESSYDVLACKVEIGTQQTLAHQDESGNWVLNEIPNFSDELLKCCMSTADSADTYANNNLTHKAVNAAPAGFGYGEAMKKVGYDNIAETTFESLLDAELASMPNGSTKQFRMTDHPTLDGTTRFAILYKADNNYATLISWSYLPTAPSSAIKQKHNGAWKPWEWEKPPMNLGVEYRTTERWNGKAVYTKMIDCGTLPNTTVKQVSHGAAVSQMLRCVGQGTSGYLDSLPYWYSDTDFCTIYASNSAVILRSGKDLSARSATAQIWYTKD